MSDLPSREVFAAAYDHLVTRDDGYIDISDDYDPEFAAYRQLMKLHVEGRLVDREAIDPNRVRAAINRHVHSASEFYDGGAWIETWADIEAAWADIEAALAEEI